MVFIANTASSKDIITTAQPGAFLSEFFSEFFSEFLKSRATEKQSLDEVLVILDLDDTTITTHEGQWLGRSAMFYDLLDHEMQLFPKERKSHIAERIDPLLSAIYKKVPVITTDTELPRVIRELQGKGIKVIAMTARGQRVKDITMEQLDRVGVNFSDLGDPRWIALKGERQFRVERHGVVFVSHGNKKGEVLVELMNEGEGNIPKEIIFIDDREKHLWDVRDAVREYNKDIKFTPVLCTYLENKMTYDSKQAYLQMIQFLVEKKDDEEIKKLIEKDPYTISVIDRCGTRVGDSDFCSQLKTNNP